MNRAIILAAGKGTRMNSTLPKVLHKVGNKPMVLNVIDSLKEAGVEEIIVVVGYESEQVKRVLPTDVKTVIQNEQRGTGHAVMMAKELLLNKDGKTLVIAGDTPLVKPSTIKKAFQNNAECTILTMIPTDASAYGRIVRKDGKVCSIVEFKDANESEKNIKEVNTGIYIFDNKKLFSNIDKIGTNNAQNEFYLTDIISIFLEKGFDVESLQVSCEEAIGVNNLEDLKEAERIWQTRQ